MRTRVKICGITSWTDARAALAAGADALGFVFYERSPRRIAVDAAAAILRRLPPFVAKVGLFVDAPEETVRQTAAACGLDTLQFHGAESPEYCRRFSQTVYKAFRVRDRGVFQGLPQYATTAWLLDSCVAGQPGGTGTRFDWSLAAEAVRLGTPVILAGGLTPENVPDAIRQVRPYAVDVSSGVEASPGVKDAAKLNAFLAAVTRATNEGV
jgi:phosphoribosylanthranilate isomerase